MRYNGVDTFVAGAVLTNAAKCSTDGEYCLLHWDLTSGFLIDWLVAAIFSATTKDRNADRRGRAGSIATLAPVP
jgi:hypothetical protein